MRDLNSTFYKTAQKSKLAQIKTKRTKLDTDGRCNSDWKALRKKNSDDYLTKNTDKQITPIYAFTTVSH